ncbi:MAG: hypothetical protein ACERKS_04670 [Candidatus Bathyarchaeota archaeon]
MSPSEKKDIDPVERFHEYTAKPKIARDSLEDLLTSAQEIRELEIHYRDNRIYIERFLRDMLEQLRSTGGDTADTGVCSPEFVESLKFIER